MILLLDGNTGTQTGESIVSYYYYNQLNETAKTIYDGLKENKDKFISGNYTIDYGTKFNTLLNTDGGEQKLNEAFQSAWNAFSYDNVDLFYIDVSKMTLVNEYTSLAGIRTYKISIGPGENENYFQENFHSQAEVEDAKKYIEGIKEQVVKSTSSNDAYTKITRIHNWLIENITYDSTSTTGKERHTIYGTLKNAKAVCEGYARTFKYIMDGIGVPCVLVSGTGTNSQNETESHAWNYVQLNEKWYAIDVTWDDPVITGGGQLTDELKYKYFLRGSEVFKVDHKEDGRISENSMSFKFPTLDKEDYKK